MNIKITALLLFSLLHSATLVVTQSVENGYLQEDEEFIGTLTFKEKSNLASEVSGIVDDIYVNEGQYVRKNTKLALLNSDLLNQDIASKEALLEQANAILQKNQKDFERFESLYKSNSISFKEYEDALFTLKAQEGAKGSILADLQRLKKERDKKILSAPYDGVIISRSVQLGEWVNTGDSLFIIANLKSLEITVDVPFSVLRSLKIGQNVKVIVADKPYHATITAIIPLGNSKARTFPIKLSLADDQHELIEGLEARVQILRNNETQNGFLIPRDAILPSNNGTVVYVARESKAICVEITVNKYSGNLALVYAKDKDTLRIGDKVITKGHERIEDGSEIIESTSTSSL